jgi:hypothetical protein
VAVQAWEFPCPRSTLCSNRLRLPLRLNADTGSRSLPLRLNADTGSRSLMSQPATPFTAAQNTTIKVPANTKCILRLENLASVFTIVKVNKDAATNDADYFLTGGDAVEIVCHDDATVNVLNVTGTPKCYYRLEPLSQLGS